MKIAHHGSKYTTSIPFLNKVKPQIAVISVGPNNYGHPSQIILDRLIKRKIKIYRTDENGDIIIGTDGKKINVMIEKAIAPPSRKN